MPLYIQRNKGFALLARCFAYAATRREAGDQPQAHAAGMLGEVKVGGVLDAQHDILSLHALQMRCQDVLRRDLDLRRLVDQAEVAWPFTAARLPCAAARNDAIGWSDCI